MKLYAGNSSSDAIAYLSGELILSANTTSEIIPGLWHRLLKDPTFLNDVRLNNLQLSDGVKTYRSAEEISAFISLLEKAIEIETPLVLEGIAAGLATKNADTEFIYVLPGARIISRIVLLALQTMPGDYLKIEVLDPNNVVLQTPSPKCYVMDGRGELPLPYKKLPAGLKLRITYHSVAGTLDNQAFFALNVLWAYI